MAGKNGATMTKGKDSKPAATMGDGWKTSKYSKADLKRLVDEWNPTTGDKRPYEKAEEIVLFQYFVERGLALPTSNFFCSLLFDYGIQLPHINPN
jgi:hypothetical protein